MTLHLYDPATAPAPPESKPSCGGCVCFERSDDPTGIAGVGPHAAGRCNWQREKKPDAYRPWRAESDSCCEFKERSS